jgi:hypothetical protein
MQHTSDDSLALIRHIDIPVADLARREAVGRCLEPVSRPLWLLGLFSAFTPMLLAGSCSTFPPAHIPRIKREAMGLIAQEIRIRSGRRGDLHLSLLVPGRTTACQLV